MKTKLAEKNPIRLLAIFMSLIFIVLSLNSCDEKEEGGTAYISDENLYSFVGNAMVNCFTDIYNQNLAGTSSGNKNLTANGPMGGELQISGSTSYTSEHGITMVDLVYEMDEVKYTYSSTTSSGNKWFVSITMTGDITYKGSFSSSSYTAVNHQSNNLYIKGYVSYNTDEAVRYIDNSGAVSINRSTNSTSVTIFGNSAAWSW